MLRAQSLSLALAGRQVLDTLSATLRPGRVSVILGPNGAGKSMLLACLAGLRTPTSGAALLNDRPVLALPAPERARAIGFLPQRGEIHWDVDVAALVALGRTPHSGRWGLTPRDRAAIAEAMVATDTERLSGRRVTRLSGGEQARVLLARVLAGEPQWLLADEPLASLDPAHQLDVLDRLRRVAAAGVGVVLVLHDLTHAARIANDALLLREGALLAAGTAAEVLTPPNLSAAYDCTIWSGSDESGAPLLIPVPGGR
jgi:iron complex transport system ATP-binding protein